MSLKNTTIKNLNRKKLKTIREKATSFFVEYRSDLSSRPNLKPLASIFSIGIDSSRLEDYYVRSFDEEALSISIVDKRTETIYEAHYYIKKENPVYSETVVLQTTETKGDVQIKKIYCVAFNELLQISDKLRITHNDLVLVFKKDGNSPLEIGLEKNYPDDNHNCQTRLLHARQLGPEKSKTRGGRRDTIAFSSSDYESWQRVLKTDDLLHYTIRREASGVADIWGFVRNKLEPKRQDKYCDDHLIHLTFCDPKYSQSSYLDVYKSNTDLVIFLSDEVRKSEFQLPTMAKDSLTLDELDSIIRFLKEEFGQYPMIQMTIDILTRFAWRLKIHLGLETREEDLLAPELFEGLSFEEIIGKIEANKYAYFGYAIKDYETLKTGENVTKEKNFTNAPVQDNGNSV